MCSPLPERMDHGPHTLQLQQTHLCLSQPHYGLHPAKFSGNDSLFLSSEFCQVLTATLLPTPEGWKAELACLVSQQLFTKQYLADWHRTIVLQQRSESIKSSKLLVAGRASPQTQLGSLQYSLDPSRLAGGGARCPLPENPSPLGLTLSIPTFYSMTPPMILDCRALWCKCNPCRLQ